MKVREQAKIPDDYVGDEHLKNWLIRNLGMSDLKQVFVSPEFLREDLTRSRLDLFRGSEVVLVFEKHKVMMSVLAVMTTFSKLGIAERMEGF